MIMTRNVFLKTSVVGVEDGGFQKGITKAAILAVVLLKGAKVEKVKIKRIFVDDLDTTEKLVEA